MTCPDVSTDLSLEEGFVLLEPYFLAERERCLEFGLDRCRRIRMVCDDVHDTERHFAGCREDGLLIALAPELLEQPPETICAIIAHEFGHAADFLYPGEFVFRGDDRPAGRRRREDFKDSQWHAWLRDWRRRDSDLVERSADAIAHAVHGVRYGYLGPCQLQTFGETARRPLGLR